ncbi:tRNA (adenine(22)-N(1))-methyltransferase TrmK [Priestia aryabhattai]|uniref:tRNA (adenine(22)-N(1))-methyltransferase n=1 Tax=Priestia aryabhattai TaxID=412384 RepID=UPI001C8EFD73|nr:tRNA (adenine(22)-N(1))-methyltransferase TrmK [Priestia aryabhattai]MBY0026894.1 tRNA (adenine(22)-N(1))-methyltransferase TrmK [Priestia aryabhattai]
MNELNLSTRLEEVVKSIPLGAKIADIGSDHAYLPCFAYLNGYISSAIAGEITEGPLQSAIQQVKKTNLTDVIDVRKGNGLEVISPNEVDCITICGMGGTLITMILEEGKEKLEGVKRLVLQPNIGSHHIRSWLIQYNWEIIDEKIIEEDGRMYEVIVAEPGNALAPYNGEVEAGVLMGPILKEKRSSAFMTKWAHELNHLKQIVSQMEQAQSEESKAKLQKLTQDISLIEEALK